jgi:predicted RNA binding protein YcfA (HicA-like mRNA interferase family)
LVLKELRQREDHVILKRRMPGGEVGCVVPLHRELKIGTLRGILKTSKDKSRGIYKPPLGNLLGEKVRTVEEKDFLDALMAEVEKA